MPLIDTPPDAVAELRQYRTLNSKRFDLGNGFHRIIHRLGLVHFQDDDGSLKDIDTSLRIDQTTGDTVADQLPFRFRLLKTGIGYLFQSRSGGVVRVELRRVGTTAIDTNATFTPTRSGNRLVFADVDTDLDIVFQVNRNGIQSFRRLKSAAAARQWRWAISYDAAGQSKIDSSLKGFDGSDPQRRVLTGFTTQDTQPQDNGNGTFTLLHQETWDGTVVTRDPVTRVPSVTSDPVYPVLIDPDVSDHISGTADDGTDYVSGYQWYNFTVQLQYRSGFPPKKYLPAFRFQNVTIAQGATLSNATLKINVTAKGSVGFAGAATIFGDQAANSVAWTNSTRVSTRTKTSHSTSFPQQSSTGIKSLNVTTAVQDIINGASWASGNALSLFMDNVAALSDSYNTLIEDYSAAGTNEAVLEITLAATGGGTAPRMIAGGEHLGLLLWEAAGLC